MKILILKYRNIGDVLLSTALVSNLKHYFPNALIDFAVNKETEDILKHNPNLNKVYSYDRDIESNSSLLKKISYEIKNLLFFRRQKYDILINLTEGDRGVLIALFSGAEKKFSFKPRRGLLKFFNFFDQYGYESDYIHTVERDLQFLNFLGYEKYSNKIDIFWTKEDETIVDDILKKNNLGNYVHIHPVSRWMYKCWENDRMAQLVDFISLNSDLKVVITGSNSKKEIAHIDSIIPLCKSPPINLSGLFTLNQLAYLSSKARFFFGIDSAPMHIAAAVGTKVVALFGSSSPEIWGPWDNNQGSTYQDIIGVQHNGQHKVFSHTDRSIFFDKNIKKGNGMVSIQIQDVLNEIKKYL